MSGYELYQKYIDAGQNAAPDSPEREYAQTLRTARYVVPPEELFSLLVAAEVTGQRIELTYPIPEAVGPSEPSGIQLSDSL